MGRREGLPSSGGERRLRRPTKTPSIAKSNAFKSLYREAKKVCINGKQISKDGLINIRKKRDEDDGGDEPGTSAGAESGSKRGREE